MSDEQADITTSYVLYPNNSSAALENPKRVAAGKAIAEKTRQVWEEQKKALAKAAVIIANNEVKKDTSEPVNADPTPEPADPPQPPESVYWGFSTTQWLMAGGIVVGLLRLYYKREEIEAACANLFNTQSHNVVMTAPNVCTPAPNVDTMAPNVGTTVGTTSPNIGARMRQAAGISKMD